MALYSIEFVIMPLHHKLPLYAQRVECIVVTDHHQGFQVAPWRWISVRVGLRLEVIIVTLDIASVNENGVRIY